MKRLSISLALVGVAAVGGWLVLRPAATVVVTASHPTVAGHASASTAPAAATVAADAAPDKAAQAQSLPPDQLATHLEEMLARAEADRLAGKPMPPHPQVMTHSKSPVLALPKQPPRRRPEQQAPPDAPAADKPDAVPAAAPPVTAPATAAPATP